MKTKNLLYLLTFFWSTLLFAQEKRVDGTITEESGEPLPGVNIIVKGTTSGTTTDIDGRFLLNVQDDAILLISYVGFLNQEVAVNGKSTINVQLKADLEQLDEIIVVGYGSVKKSDITGSLASVSSKDFEQQPLTRIDQALQGRAAGVQVNQTSGAPGAGFKIRVRGANSINGSNNPLYVVDGMVVGDINSINLNDIKSMEVLKDASATAIYGSRGANGIVLITTKTGRTGKAKVEFDSFVGTSNVFQKLDLLSPAEFAEGVNFAEGQTLYSDADIAALQAGGGENWQDRFLQSGRFSNHQISVSGGSEKTDYYVSGNIYNADGTIIDQNYKRYTFRTNINSKVSDKLKIGINTFGSREERTGVRANFGGGLTWDPTTPAVNENGEYNFTPIIPGVGNGGANPLIAPENNKRANYLNKVIANGYLDFTIIDGLVLNISGGLEKIDRTNNSYTSILLGTGNANVYNQEINRYQNTNRLTYTLDKNPNHKLQIDAIHEQQLVTDVWTRANAEGFFSDNTTYKNLALGSIQRNSNFSSSESLQSFLGRLNYILLDRFMLTASVRTDGSSKFREGNRWGVFPSAAFAWRISDESFIENITVIDNLKLRMGYGVTGSQGINALATRSQPIINPAINYPFEGQSATIGVAPSNRLANPNLTWEQTAQSNIGVDLGLWESKVTLSVDLYHKKTTDLLLDVFLPEFVGPTVVARNIGEVENKGFEINLGITPLHTEDWQITTNFNLSRNVNKVVALVNDEPIEKSNALQYGINGIPVNPTRVEVGQPISAFRGYVFEGVYQSGEASEAAEFGRNPGDAKYKDVNGDGNISPDDIVTIGDGNPDFTWGLNTNVSYKNFNLNFLMTGSHGNDIYNLQRGRMMALGAQQFHATHGDYRNRWTSTNPSNIPSGRDGTQWLSTQFLESGSYVTLKNVSLSYNFGDITALSKLGLSSVRLYGSAENLFILTDYTGFDPETTTSGNSDVDLGIDYNTYPLSQSFTIGLNLTF